uniref:Uncharacterized protein n=1 Tax=Cacopsylla melanoneura TaxID=428564 RepID=A0A8D8UGF5_9HEMI
MELLPPRSEWALIRVSSENRETISELSSEGGLTSFKSCWFSLGGRGISSSSGLDDLVDIEVGLYLLLSGMGIASGGGTGIGIQRGVGGGTMAEGAGTRPTMGGARPTMGGARPTMGGARPSPGEGNVARGGMGSNLDCLLGEEG